MNPFEPFKPPFHCDDMATYIWDSQEHMVVQIRGWGRLTGHGSGGLKMDHEAAYKAQKRIGDETARAMNELCGIKEGGND